MQETYEGNGGAKNKQRGHDEIVTAESHLHLETAGREGESGIISAGATVTLWTLHHSGPF